MAKYIRYSDAFLARVREEANLPAMVNREVPLKRSGSQFTACCPFHNEKTASFTVSTEKNTFRCYGCGAKGDAIDWMVRRHHMSFPEAVAYVADSCGIALPEPDLQGSVDEEAQRRRLAGQYQALKEAARLYSSGLDRSPAGRKYLFETRHLTDATVATFGLGVVATGVIDLMSSRISLQVLESSGLAVARDSGGHFDRFRNRVMIPIHNEQGTLIGFAGRSLIAKPDRAPKYLNSPETELFHKGRELYALDLAKAAIRRTNTAIVVEGYFDVISLYQAGEQRAVAPMGTAFTNHQARRLLVHADELIFAFDGDKAGRKAALRAAAVVLEELKDGKSAKFLFLPDGSDPDNFIRESGLDQWQLALQGACPMSRLLNDYVKHGLDLTLPETQVKAAEKAKAILARIKQAEMFKRAMTLNFEHTIGVPLH